MYCNLCLEYLDDESLLNLRTLSSEINPLDVLKSRAERVTFPIGIWKHNQELPWLSNHMKIDITSIKQPYNEIKHLFCKNFYLHQLSLSKGFLLGGFLRAYYDELSITLLALPPRAGDMLREQIWSHFYYNMHNYFIRINQYIIPNEYIRYLKISIQKMITKDRNHLLPLIIDINQKEGECECCT